MIQLLRDLCGRLSFRKALLVSGTALILVDLLLIGAHVATHLARAPADGAVPRRWAITRDGSYGELYNYGKFMLTAGLMGALWLRHRAVIYLAWAAVFGILLLDDMLQMHERGGAFLVSAWSLGAIWGIRPAAFTSVIILALLGAAIVILVASGFLLSPRRHNPAGYLMLGVMGGLVFCGVFVDFLGTAAETLGSGTLRSYVLGGLGTLEDGGEMVFASFGTALAIGLWRTEWPAKDVSGGLDGEASLPEGGARLFVAHTR